MFWFLNNYNINRIPQLKEELELMLNNNRKVEIQALTSKGFNYTTEEYLPNKLSSSDLIKLS